MNLRAFTDLEIARLEATGRQHQIPDPKKTNLYLLMSPGGTKTWRFIGSRNGKQVAKKIGRFGQFGVNDARAEALRLAADLAQGNLGAPSPADGPTPSPASCWTVAEALESYIGTRDIVNGTAQDYRQEISRWGWVQSSYLMTTILLEFFNPDITGSGSLRIARRLLSDIATPQTRSLTHSRGRSRLQGEPSRR